jgi:rRNA maturation endonuclease Nob1
VKDSIQSCKKCGRVNLDPVEEKEKCFFCGGEMKIIIVKERLGKEEERVEHP